MSPSRLKLDYGNNLLVPNLPVAQGRALDVVLGQWDTGLAVLNQTDDMSLVNAALDDHFIALLQRNNTAISAWVKGIPDTILQSASNHPLPYSALVFAATSPHSAQLLCNSPILFSLLVNYAVQNQCGHSWFAQVVSTKRAAVLQRVTGLALQYSKSAVKFLQRLDHQRLFKSDLDTVIIMLQQGDYRRFTHHQKIPLALLSLFSDYPFIQHNKWLFHLQSNRQCLDIAAIIDDILSLSGRLNVGSYFTDQIIRACSVDALNHLQTVLIKLAKIKDDLADIQPFPSAPVQGDNWIQPVSDAYSLYKVGALQDNCVFDYLDAIKGGQYYVYQVKGKCTATLGLHIKYDGIVLIDQLLAASNRPVSDDLHQAIKRWLQNSSFSRNRVFNHRLLADYKAKHQDHLMSDYLAYSRPGVHKTRQIKHVADLKKRQMDQLMNDYADYCASSLCV